MEKIDFPQNIVHGGIEGGGNVIVGNSNTIINLKEAADYIAIEAAIKKLDTRFERTLKRFQKDTDDREAQEELLEINIERSKEKENLETLKKTVIKLAEDFQRIPLDTERLRLAKQYFDKGEFKEARAIFDAETMGKELEALLHQKENLSKKSTENQQNLNDKANEYLIFARLTAINFDLPDRFEKTVASFEQSLRAERNIENLFAYSYFLQNHNKYSQTLPLYEEALQLTRKLAEQNPQIDLPVLDTILDNLAILYSDQNQFSKAQPLHEEALQRRTKLALQYPQNYLPKVALSQNNLATLFRHQKEFSKAQSMYEKALQNYIESVDQHSLVDISDLAVVIYNLGALYLDRNEFSQSQFLFEKALRIYRELAGQNELTYLPFVAIVLNGLADLYLLQNKFSEAQPKYEEALQIRIKLIVHNPYLYLPLLGDTLNNFASLRSSLKEFSQARFMVEKSLGIFVTFAKYEPQVYEPKVIQVKANLKKLHQEMNIQE